MGYVYRGEDTLAQEQIKINAAARKNATTPANYIAQIVSNRSRHKIKKMYAAEYDYLKRVVCGRLGLVLTNPKDANAMRSIVEAALKRRHLEEWEGIKAATRVEVYKEYNYKPGARGIREGQNEALVRELVAMDVPIADDNASA